MYMYRCIRVSACRLAASDGFQIWFERISWSSLAYRRCCRLALCPCACATLLSCIEVEHSATASQQDHLLDNIHATLEHGMRVEHIVTRMHGIKRATTLQWESLLNQTAGMLQQKQRRKKASQNVHHESTSTGTVQSEIHKLCSRNNYDSFGVERTRLKATSTQRAGDKLFIVSTTSTVCRVPLMAISIEVWGTCTLK